MNEGLPWHLEEVDLPGFKGEFAVRGASALTAEFQGFLATINMLNDLERQVRQLQAALREAPLGAGALAVRLGMRSLEVVKLRAQVEQLTRERDDALQRDFYDAWQVARIDNAALRQALEDIGDPLRIGGDARSIARAALKAADHSDETQ